MSEPLADAIIPDELGQQAESVKDAHLEPAKDEDHEDSGSEDENEDGAAVNGAGQSLCCTTL